MDHSESLRLSLPYELCEEILLFAGTLHATFAHHLCREGGAQCNQEPEAADTDTILIQLLVAHPPSRRLLRSLCLNLSWFTLSHALFACNLQLFDLLIEAKYHPKPHRQSLEWALVHGDLAVLDHLRLNVHLNDPTWYIPPDIVWLTCLSPKEATQSLDWWIKYAPRKTQLVNLRHTGTSNSRLRDVAELPTARGTPEMYLKDWFLKSGLYPHHMYQCVTRPCSYMGAANVLEWWRAHGAEKMGMACQGSELDVASARGHLDVLRWWCATGWELKWTEWAMDEAAENGFVCVLDWWVKESGLRPIRYTHRMWDAGKRHVAVREWLRQQSGLLCEPVDQVAMQGNVEAGLVEAFESAVKVDDTISRIPQHGAGRSRSRSQSRGRVKWDCIVSENRESGF